MIAELFYPKELKEIIADLRAKGDLNEDALANIRFIPVKVFICWLLIVILFWLTLRSVEYFIVSFFVSGLFSLFILMYEFYAAVKKSLVYVRGILKNGTVVSLRHSGRSPTLAIKIVDDVSGEIVAMGKFMSNQVGVDFPKSGEKISYFSVGNRRFMNMPNYLPIKKQYCLSLSKLKD